MLFQKGIRLLLHHLHFVHRTVVDIIILVLKIVIGKSIIIESILIAGLKTRSFKAVRWHGNNVTIYSIAAVNHTIHIRSRSDLRGALLILKRSPCIPGA
jgi:hypothetical protein